MILHKETFKEFGYWPKDLKNHSNKKIVVKCNFCKKVKITSKAASHNSKTNYCKSCGTKVIQRTKRKRIENKYWDDVKCNKNISPSFLLMLYRHVSVTSQFYSKSLGFKYSIKKNTGNYSIKEKIAILKGLGLKNMPESTKEFKKVLRKFYDKQSNFFKLEFITKVIETSYKKMDGRQLVLGVTTKYYSHFFESLNFTVNNDNLLRLIKGSFFIDGRWVHIG